MFVMGKYPYSLVEAGKTPRFISQLVGCICVRCSLGLNFGNYTTSLGSLKEIQLYSFYLSGTSVLKQEVNVAGKRIVACN